ncbi:MAG TPA: hypothetical protein GX708_15395 [Gallicola sp.]|nr:hypothetical protein [Gallicola sp.]
MNNSELLITIITISFTLVSSVLGFFLKRNEKTRKYYETYLKVEAKIKELCIVAEKAYTEGSKKKKYVLSNIHIFLKEEKLKLNISIIDDIIESIIHMSKNIN